MWYPQYLRTDGSATVVGVTDPRKLSEVVIHSFAKHQSMAESSDHESAKQLFVLQSSAGRNKFSGPF